MPFFRYTVEDGLPASKVYESLQDKRGYIWLATEYGVSRFDGERFHNYTVKDGLHVNDVWGLFQDSRERIWIKSFSPHLIYLYRDSIHRLEIPKSLQQSTISAISEDNLGNCWFTHDKGLFCLKNNGGFESFLSDTAYLKNPVGYLAHPEGGWVLFNGRITQRPDTALMENPLPFLDVHKQIGLPVYQGSGLWLVFYDSFILKYHPQTQSYWRLPLDSLLGSHGEVRLTGLLDNHPTEQLWLGTTHGIFVLNRELQPEPQYFSLANKPFKHVTKDRQGNLWFATNGDGLYFYPATALAMNMVNYSLATDDGTEKISSLAFHGQENWFAGTDKGALYHFNGSRLVKHLAEVHTSINMIHCIGGKSLLIGSNMGISWHPLEWFGSEDTRPAPGGPGQKRGSTGFPLSANASNFISLTLKNSFHDPASSSLLLAAREGVFRVGPGKGGFALEKTWEERSYGVCLDTEGQTWVGSPRGVTCIEKGQVLSGLDHPLLHVSVLDLLWQEGGVLWVATDGYGLFGYRPGDGRFYVIREMQNEVVKDIASDPNGCIWAATNQGVRCICIKDLEDFEYDLYTLGRREGLISNEINRIYPQGERVFAATNAGISVFDPFPWPTDTLRPRVYLDGFRTGKVKGAISGGMVFPHNNNDITIFYSSPVFQKREQVGYQYRLLGHSSAWIQTSSPEVTFHNLPPGEYGFEIKAAEGGLNARVARWAFAIDPHWSQTALFKWTVIALALAGIVIFVVWRFRVERQRSRLRMEITGLQARALQTQMNPHFIFNSLNAIQALVGSERPEDANEYLVLFARLIRMNLELSGQRWVSLQTELHCLETYLQLELLRFRDALTYEIVIAGDVYPHEVAVPPLFLQPFVENAILHGILPLETRRGKVRVNVERTGADLVIHVADNGIGLEEAQLLKRPDHVSKGVGLIEQRLRLLFGALSGEQRVLLASHPNGDPGTVVHIRLPYKTRLRPDLIKEPFSK